MRPVRTGLWQPPMGMRIRPAVLCKREKATASELTKLQAGKALPRRPRQMKETLLRKTRQQVKETLPRRRQQKMKKAQPSKTQPQTMRTQPHTAKRQIRQLAETVRRKACLNLLQRTQERTDPKHPPRPQQKKVLQARRQAGRTALQKQKTTLLLRQEQERRRDKTGTAAAAEKPGLYRMPEARRTGTAVPSLRMPPLRMLPLRHPQNPRRKNPG